MLNRWRPIATAAILVFATPVAAQAARGYATATVNMRAGPSIDYPVVAVIPDDARINIHGCLSDYDWCDVSWRANRGWVSATYLNYFYRSRYVYLPDYVDVIDVPVVTFTLGTYWGNYYTGRPWYHRLGYWEDYWRLHGRYGHWRHQGSDHHRNAGGLHERRNYRPNAAGAYERRGSAEAVEQRSNRHRHQFNARGSGAGTVGRGTTATGSHRQVQRVPSAHQRRTRVGEHHVSPRRAGHLGRQSSGLPTASDGPRNRSHSFAHGSGNRSRAHVSHQPSGLAAHAQVGNRGRHAGKPRH